MNAGKKYINGAYMIGESKMESKKSSKFNVFFKILLAVCVLYVPVMFLRISIAHGIVMKGFGYEKYDYDRYLLYSDVKNYK